MDKVFKLRITWMKSHFLCKFFLLNSIGVSEIKMLFVEISSLKSTFFKLLGSVLIFILGLTFWSPLSYYSQSNCRNVKDSFTSKQHPIMCYYFAGKLGNQMFDYAVLYSIANQRNILSSTFQGPQEFSDLHKYFNTTLPYISYSVYNCLDWTEVLVSAHIDKSIQNLRSGLDTAPYLRLSGYPHSWRYFEKYRTDILSEFKLLDSVEILAEERINKILKSLSANRNTSTIVGVHVRRAEYVGFMGRHKHILLPGTGFYKEAMSYFHSKYSNVVFIVASDDIPWSVETFSILKANGLKIGYLNDTLAEVAGYDLAVLSKCKHVIFSFSTFGFWGAYLSGGDVIFCSDCIQATTSWMEDYSDFSNFVLPDWIGFNRRGERSSNLARYNESHVLEYFTVDDI